MLYSQITGRDGQITVHSASASRPRANVVGLCLHMCVVTFLCDGDLPGLSVDLEQGGVVLVGNLTSQTVFQLSVGSCFVVPIHSRNPCECNTWETARVGGYKAVWRCYIVQVGTM